MSPQEQHELREQYKRDYDKTKSDLAHVRLELERIGIFFERLGKQLQGDPLRSPMEVENTGVGRPYFDYIQKRLDELRDLTAETKRLRDRLASVGVHVD